MTEMNSLQEWLAHAERLHARPIDMGLERVRAVASRMGLRIEARVITVADIVEAMASHRPFRPSRGIEAALEEIGAQKGKTLDEGVVDACIGIFRDGDFALDEG